MATQQGSVRQCAPVNGAGGQPRRKKKKKKNNTLIFSVITLGVLGIGLVIFQFIFKAAETVSMDITPIPRRYPF
jgi:flagellar basal body-associated protein FliL